MRTSLLLSLSFALLTAAVARMAVDDCDLTWSTPSEDSSGSMPLGNGDVALNAWVEANGDLHLLLAKGDAWSENTRLLKLGLVRLSFDPNPFTSGKAFKQTLRLRRGAIEIVAGSPEIRTRLWIDIHHPVVHVESESPAPFRVSAELELWRTSERQMERGSREEFSALGMEGGPDAIIVYPDTVLDEANALAWYHRNERSPWQANMELQGLGGLVDKYEDPLLHRTFGARVEATGLVSDGSMRLVAPEARTGFHVRIVPLTRQTETAEAWVSQLDELAEKMRELDLERTRAAHRKWWEEYFERSGIEVSSDHLAERAIRSPLPLATVVDTPLRIGADPRGNNRFRGAMDGVRVWGRALSEEEIASDAASSTEALLIDLAFETGAKYPTNAVIGGPTFEVSGKITPASGHGGRGTMFPGDSWLEAPDQPALNMQNALTLEAWVRPASDLDGSGRVIDKALPGTDRGYMLDLYQGRPRFIVKGLSLSAPEALPPEQWSHLAATLDVERGAFLYVNGKRVAGRAAELPVDPAWLTQIYALQRFVHAAAGRSEYPIKFNGSLFSVGGDGCDYDFRRWGGGYWFQNTRLPYWSMLISGDFDLWEPFVDLYMDVLPISKDRAQLYFDHEGALIPEMIWFWGTYPNRVYGWDRTDKPPDFIWSSRIIVHYNGMLELVTMMLDYYAFTENRAFAREKLLPMAREVLTFFEQHFPRDEKGRLLIPKGQALESWDDVRNPVQDIAGLQYVLDRLLLLPRNLYPAGQREAWQALRKIIPPLTFEEIDGATMIAVGEVNPGQRRNVENPELYAVFPFRLYAVGEPNIEIGRTTWRQRDMDYYWGWHQDDIHAAMLGMTDEAKRYLIERTLPSDTALRSGPSDSGQRFPVFWGPGHDWIPDGDHSGVAMITLEAMLLQYSGDRIFLLPAWPRDWDVEFKLHAPQRTVVEGKYRGGQLVELSVTPAERKDDIVLPDWLETPGRRTPK